MLSALASDFAAVCNHVHLVADPRFQLTANDFTSGEAIATNITIHPLESEPPLWSQWIQAARGCDRAMVIAPETDGVLAQSVAMLQAAGLTMLNGFGDYLRCASDKWETARIFTIAGVPHPPTWTAETIPWEQLPVAHRWVVKPRDGCGTENVRVYPSIEAAAEAAAGTNMLIQPWIEGRGISVAAIVDNSELTVLPAVSQLVTAEDVGYRGGAGPLCDDDQQRAAFLARTAITALPRTVKGYLGLDLVLADDPTQDCVIEVNPRLTTSYVGLRKIVRGNLAARILGLDRSPVSCAVDCNQVHWEASGQVWID